MGQRYISYYKLQYHNPFSKILNTQDDYNPGSTTTKLRKQSNLQTLERLLQANVYSEDPF